MVAAGVPPAPRVRVPSVVLRTDPATRRLAGSRAAGHTPRKLNKELRQPLRGILKKHKQLKHSGFNKCQEEENRLSALVCEDLPVQRRLECNAVRSLMNTAINGVTTRRRGYKRQEREYPGEMKTPSYATLLHKMALAVEKKRDLYKVYAQGLPRMKAELVSSCVPHLCRHMSCP